MERPPVQQSQNAIRLALENDKRDIKDLWNEALKDYRDMLGKDLQLRATPNFRNVDEMIQFGALHEDAFNKWRHDGKSLDKIRSLLMQNMDLIQSGTQKLLAAATSAFPPAAAIGAALTFVLYACKGQSADYDIVVSFMEEMNNFLQRVTILEGRLPGYGAYQTCLMDVFTAFLRMCAFATKFMAQGRLKTWFVTSFIGQDAALASARNKMDKNLAILESATQFAILANTDGLKGGQQGLQIMQAELHENQARQLQLQREQTELMRSIQQGQNVVQVSMDALRTDLQAITAMMRQKEDISPDPAAQDAAQKSNSVRASIAPNSENDARMTKLRETRLRGTGEWLFQTSVWKSWSATKGNAILLLQGQAGIGKSHLAAAAYDHLSNAAKRDRNQDIVVVYFFCDSNEQNLNTFDSLIASIVLQTSEQNPILQSQFAQKFASKQEVVWSALQSASERLQDLILPSFGKDSHHQLCIVMDNVDEFAFQGDLAEMLDSVSDLSPRIKLILTCRSASSDTLDSKLRSKLNDPVTVLTMNLTRVDILPDIKLLIADRLQARDVAYGDLTHLSSRTKCIIRDQIEDKATTLLYVNFALRHLSGISREGVIVRELERGLPLGASALFLEVLKSCKRRLPQDLSKPTQLLLTWLTYSFDLLDLDQANQLVLVLTRDRTVRIEDEIEYVFSRILQIGPTKKTSRVKRHRIMIEVSEDLTTTEDTSNDGDLLVSLRDPSMKQFLRNIDIASWDGPEIMINQEENHTVRSSLSSANHRLMFMYCCRILQVERSGDRETVPSKSAEKLRQYAMRYCLRHWQNINCTQHEYSENMEVCSTFFNLMANPRGLAATLAVELTSFDEVVKKFDNMSVEDGHQIFSQTWHVWAKLNRETNKALCGSSHEPVDCMHDAAQTYWQDSYEHAFQPLFEAHMDNWLDGWDVYWQPQRAYLYARGILPRTPYKDLSKLQVADEYWKPWIDTEPEGMTEWQTYVRDNIKTAYLLRSLYRRPLTSTAHLATASVFDYTGEQAGKARLQELLLAADKCVDSAQEAKIHIELSGEYGGLALDEYGPAGEDNSYVENRQHALDHIDLAIKMFSDKTSTTRHSALLKKVTLLQELNEISYGGSIDGEIVEIFHEIRTHSEKPLIDERSVLHQELLYYTGSDERVMNFFGNLTPTQRLALLIYGSGKGIHLRPEDLNRVLLPAAVSTGRINELVDMYEQMIRDLKLGHCEIVWYAVFAHSHRAVRNVQQAWDLLREAFTYVFKTSVMRIGSGYYYAHAVIENYINLASDVAYQRFRACNQADVKMLFLQDAEAILSQPLAQSVRLIPSNIIPHLVVLARMQKKIGTFQKYQESLQQAFDMCWANLGDDNIYNDMQNMLYLTKILAMIPAFRREVEIASSAQLYFLGKYPELGKIGDPTRNDDTRSAEDIENAVGYSTYISLQRANVLRTSTLFHTRPCARSENGNKCMDPLGWMDWEQGPMYVCLCCTTSLLCQDCYNERIERNSTPGQAEDELDFCCDAGEYIKAPMDGWKGVSNGKIYIENEEPIEVKDFLQNIKDKWNQWWEEFWMG